jgi:hypothetical protein
MRIERAEDLWLVPRPNRVELLGGAVRVGRGALAGVVEHVEQPMKEPRSRAGQAYRVRVDVAGAGGGGEGEGRVEVWAASSAGLRMARATLAQLERRLGTVWPRMEIEDEPVFAVRGVMLDVSRCRVPTMAWLMEMLGVLAGLKVNHVQLYTEHTFAYSGHEGAWAGWSAVTGPEIDRLVERAGELGIEVAANQNCFGHLAHWLRMERYAGLAETHGAWMFDVWPRSGPFSLSPVAAGSIELVRDWLGQLRGHFPSGLVNVGGDETYDVGFGQSRAEAERRGGGSAGRVSLYAEFMNKVAAAARGLGFRPMFWADVALTHPEALAALDESMIALAWGYEGDARFAEVCQRAAEGGREAWVCPGTSAWRSITGRSAERRANLKAACEQGLAHGAAGWLACEWGDVGHRQTWPVTAHALAHAAHAGWSGRADEGFSLEGSGLHVLGDETGRLGAWMEALGDADVEARRVAIPLSRPGVSGAIRNQTALFADLHTPMGAGLEVPSGVFERVLERVGSLAGARPVSASALINDELEQTLLEAEWAARRAVWRRAVGGAGGEIGERGGGGGRGGSGGGGGRSEALALGEVARRVIAGHRRLWLARARVGGLAESSAMLEKIAAELEAAAGRTGAVEGTGAGAGGYTARA